MPPAAPRRSSPGRALLAQVLVSAAVLVLLLLDTRMRDLGRALSVVSLPWLLAAGASKGAALIIRELRLWVMLRTWGRPRLAPVLSVGLASGLLNIVLPARGGDLAAAALLHRAVGVPGPAALAAVGLTSVVEAVVFGLVLLASMLLAGARWEALIGLSETHRALGSLSVVTLGVLGAGVALALVARRLRRCAPVEGSGPRTFLLRLVNDTGRGLEAARILAVNALLALVQVGCILAGSVLLMRAVGLELAAPWMAAVAVMAVGSLVAILLPPTLVAGNAATSVGVLGLFGVPQAAGLAFGVLMWTVHCLPTLLLGVWPLWRTAGRMGAAPSVSAPEEPPAPAGR
ncbi:MAG: lysylphosphatidylglycerol synthase transmembrane domain-containing protein [Pseudomonadota bacterium]